MPRQLQITVLSPLYFPASPSLSLSSSPVAVATSCSTLSLNSVPNASLNSLSATIEYLLSGPSRILLTSSGVRHISISASAWQFVSTHPPACTSCRSIVAALRPSSSGSSILALSTPPSPDDDVPPCLMLHSAARHTPSVVVAVSITLRPGLGPHPPASSPALPRFLPPVPLEWTSVCTHTSGRRRCITPLAECATRAALEGGMRQLTALPRTLLTKPKSTISTGLSSRTMGQWNTTVPPPAGAAPLLVTRIDGGDSSPSAPIPARIITGTQLDWR